MGTSVLSKDRYLLFEIQPGRSFFSIFSQRVFSVSRLYKRSVDLLVFLYMLVYVCGRDSGGALGPA